MTTHRPVTAPSHPAAPRTSRLHFWATAYTLLVMLTGTNVPAPLYHGYEEQFGFSALTLTLVYAAYVLALVPSLLVAGPLSDSLGRRAVLLPAVALSALAALVFALADGVAWLFVARVMQGLAVGAASGALTATLSELEPGGDRRRAALVSNVATMTGLAVGALLSGTLAEYAPDPKVLPYVAEIVLLVPAAVAIATLPATRVTVPWRPRRPSVPGPLRGVFALCALAAFLAFTVIGLFLSLIPSYVAQLTGNGNLLLGSGAVALLIAGSAAAQVLAYGRATFEVQTLGLVLVGAGLAGLAVAGGLASLALLLVATVIGGAGQGLTFLGGLTEINRRAPASRHADVLSSYNVAVYLGAGVPVIGAGLLATRTGLLDAVRVFAVVMAVLCAAMVTALLLRRDGGEPKAANGGGRT
ncbi:major facilitator superfamily MFS_1 [Actinobacteria bacterium OK074]|nr:major facilitator superfamily MFS_1 [Actinobacteria bacterium OK074]